MFIMMYGGNHKEFTELARSHWNLNITGAEFDEFTRVYLQMHHSEVEFVEKTKPIFKKLRSYMVMDKAENTSHLYHEIKTSFVMGKHFQLLQFANLRNMVIMILDFVEDPNYLSQMDKVVQLHKKLSLTGVEIDEFERLFLKNANTKGEQFVSKVQEILAEFKARLLKPIKAKNEMILNL